MKSKSIAFFLITAFILNGCGPPTAKIMNSWKGSHVSQLIRSWGPPQEIATDGLNGHVYIWRTDINIPLSDGEEKTRGTITYNPYLDQYSIRTKTTYKEPVVIEGQKLRMFCVNEDGIIYTWKAKGFVVEEGDTELLVIGVVAAVVIAIIIENKKQSQYDWYFED